MGIYSLNEALAGACAGLDRKVRAPVGRPGRSGAPHPTGAPVRRNSMEAGTFETAFFVPPAKGETDRLLRAARRLLDAGRQLRREARRDGRVLTRIEQALTTLTAASVRILEELLTLARLNRGRVYPSYDHLADVTGLGRATVARALTILEGIGLLVRQRRFRRVEGDGPGPRYKQTSNAYRAFLPKALQAYLPRWLRRAPLPDDAIQYSQDRQKDERRMFEALTLEELARETVDGSLGKMLARLGAALDRQSRESQKNTEPLPNSFKQPGNYEINNPPRTKP